MNRCERIRDCKERLEALHEANQALKLYGAPKDARVVIAEILAVVAELTALRKDAA